MTRTKKQFSIDKLEVTYTCPQQLREKLSDISDNYQQGCIILKRLPPTAYAHNFEVFYCDERVGVLSFESFNPHRSNLYLNVDNELLYRNIELLYDIERELGLQYYRISKLDVCMDTNKSIVRRFYVLLHDKTKCLVLNNKKIEDRKKILEDILHISTGSLNNVRLNREFCVKGYDFELKGYDKSHEIRHSGKQYIADHLQMKRIYRMEFSFGNYRCIKEQLRLTGIDHMTLYRNLTDQSILEKIFEVALYRVLHISPNTPVLDYLLETPKVIKDKQIQSDRVNIHPSLQPLFDNGVVELKKAI